MALGADTPAGRPVTDEEDLEGSPKNMQKAITKKNFTESHKGTSRSTISNNIRYFIKKRKFPQPKAIAAAINMAKEEAKKRGTKAQLRKSVQDDLALVILIE